MLKDIDLEELEGVIGGMNACGMASLGPQDRRNGLRLAEVAYAHAKSRGMSARQFNQIGWREYARQNCVGGRTPTVTRRTVSRPGGEGVIVPLE